ncbi:MAG: hypothetical protein P8J52_10540 [Gammaproteobacteria bacterium]|nr:hypothetical protein [Gammaproteobacteria bacterium]
MISNHARLPLLVPLVVLGTFVGGILAFWLGEFHILIAITGLSVVCGLTWWRNEPPAVAFALAHQWVYIAVGDIYSIYNPDFAKIRFVENTSQAVTVAVVGLVAIALGVCLIRVLTMRQTQKQPRESYNHRRLFLVVICLYSYDWLDLLTGATISFGAANILNNLFIIRSTFLLLLCYDVFQKGKNLKFGYIAILFVIIPTFTASGTKFKEIVFLVIVAAFWTWRPWVNSRKQIARSRRILIGSASLALILFIFGSFWEGGLKGSWRSLKKSEFELSEESRGTLSNLGRFGNQFMNETLDFRFEDGNIALIKRVDTINQFQLVLNRVPQVIPHQNGDILNQTFAHITKPRFLFPNKENLGSDSEFAEKYAGLTVASNTSVGIGYMAEFYVDFGIIGVVLGSFSLGLVIGGSWWVIQKFAPTHMFGTVFYLVGIMTYFNTFESNFTKLFGGFIVFCLLTIILFLIDGGRLKTWLCGGQRIKRSKRVRLTQ